MRILEMDFSKFHTAAEVHTFLKEKMDFPDYYGGNLDALFDLLSTASEEWTFQVAKSGKPFEEGLLSVFQAAAEENERIVVTVLRKDPPSPRVPGRRGKRGHKKPVDSRG